MSRRTRALLQENNALDALLNEDNQTVMTDIVVYLRSAALSTYQQEQVRRDIWQMLHDGEQRGMDARQVLGDDHRAFCEAIIAALPPLAGRTRWLMLVRDMLPAMLVLALCWVGLRGVSDLLMAGSWPYLTLTAGDLLAQVLLLGLASYIVYWISRHAFAGSGWRLFMIVFGVLALSLLASFYLTQRLCEVHVAVVAGVMAALLLLYGALERYLD